MPEIIFNPSIPSVDLESQIENLQTTLASLNQQVIILQETLQEKDQEIAELEMKLFQCSPAIPEQEFHTDNTLTLAGALIKLYKFVFQPGKDSPSVKA